MFWLSNTFTFVSLQSCSLRRRFPLLILINALDQDICRSRLRVNILFSLIDYRRPTFLLVCEFLDKLFPRFIGWKVENIFFQNICLNALGIAFFILLVDVSISHILFWIALGMLLISKTSPTDLLLQHFLCNCDLLIDRKTLLYQSNCAFFTFEIKICRYILVGNLQTAWVLAWCIYILCGCYCVKYARIWVSFIRIFLLPDYVDPPAVELQWTTKFLQFLRFPTFPRAWNQLVSYSRRFSLIVNTRFSLVVLLVVCHHLRSIWVLFL